MTTDDDDFLTTVPDPDAEPTTAERARAKAFSELLDKTFASGRMPPAMSADDRALLEVATVIRATSGALELGASKQRNIVEEALRQAIGGNAATSLPSVGAPVIPIKRRWVPWAIAGASSLVAAAAIVLMIVRRPAPIAPATAEVPTHWKSRSADSLIGRINECKPDQDRLECAKIATVKTSSRMDHIFSDRMQGYRDRQMARGGTR